MQPMAQTDFKTLQRSTKALANVVLLCCALNRTGADLKGADLKVYGCIVEGMGKGMRVPSRHRCEQPKLHRWSKSPLAHPSQIRSNGNFLIGP